MRHVVEGIARVLPEVPTVVATGVEPSDDPLAAYLSALGVPCHRGPLDDVFERFWACLQAHSCTWVLRVCADSPLLKEGVLRAVVDARADGIDLVTTTLRPTFPSGSNAELIRATAFLAVDTGELTAHDREHVTPFLHRHPERFRIVNVESGDPRRAELSVAVNTIEDLRRLESEA